MGGGNRSNSSGAASTTTFAGRSRLHHRLQTRTIVPMASRIGWLAGPWGRRSGVAVFMEKGAQVKVWVAHQWAPQAPHTIATRDSQIGWLVGVFRRSSGAVPMQGRAA